MAIDYSAMTTLIVTKLQSAGTMDFTVNEVDLQLKQCLKEYAHFQPHIVPLTLPLESRNGTCSTTVANELTDVPKGQFLTTDPTNEKVVYNSTDHTWAVVTACASTSAVGISKDIFVKGEQYRIYNQKCSNEKQLYIGGMPDYVEIDSVEYPIGQRRNFTILNDIIELDVEDEIIADSNAGSTISQLPDTDVLIRFNRPHVLTPLTTITGKLAASVSIGATTISGSAMQAAGTLTIGDEFYIQHLRTLYTVTTAATIATTASISFYPPLEVAIADTTTTFTFTKSSLSAQQEDVFADLCAARLAINKAPKLYSQANSTIAVIDLAASALSNMTTQISAATTYIAAASTQAAAASSNIGLAGTALSLVDAQISAATTAAGSAMALINTITVALGAENDYLSKAHVDVNNAGAYISEAVAYVRQAAADEQLSGTLGGLASHSIVNANTYLSQALGNLRAASTQIQIANAGKPLEAWGQARLNETLYRLKHDTKPKKSMRYPTE